MELNYDNRILFSYRYKKIIDENYITKKRNKKDIKQTLSDKHISIFFKRMIDYLLGDEYCFKRESKHLFYSQQLNISIIVEIKKDTPYGKYQIFIESWLKDVIKRDYCGVKVHPELVYILNQSTVDYFFNISNTYEFNKNGTTYLNVFDYKDDIIKIDMFCQDSKAWHITNIELCEIY